VARFIFVFIFDRLTTVGNGDGFENRNTAIAAENDFVSML
jgi:hypothetical protein